MKKSCFNCIHLSKETDCDSDGYNEFDFYVCAKRSDDEDHYPKLDDQLYLERAKKCCDLTNMSDKYFSYCNDFGFEAFKTEKEAKNSAEERIEEYRSNAPEGWSDDVGSVCWGEIHQETIKTNEKTTEEAEEEGFTISADCDGYCDYKLTNT